MSEYYVYRCYDEDDRLLYVGCTGNIDRRMSQHRNNGRTVASHVLRAVPHRVEVTTFPDEIVASRTEAEAIRDEGPLLNIHSSRVPTWMYWNNVAAYLDDRGVELEFADLARCQGCGTIRRWARVDANGRCKECAELGDLRPEWAIA